MPFTAAQAQAILHELGLNSPVIEVFLNGDADYICWNKTDPDMYFRAIHRKGRPLKFPSKSTPPGWSWECGGAG
jgi:phosphoglycolate phosphatase-like HAD superfamily hydrolase